MYHYTYLLQNIDDQRFYIGARTSKVPPQEDIKYLGSSKTVPKSYKTRCVKYILQEHASRHAAIAHEIELHQFYDVALNQCFFNAAKQTSTGFDTTGKPGPRRGVPCSEATKEKIRQANIGKKYSKEHCEKLSNALLGRTVSEETRRKIGEANRKRLLGRKKTLDQIKADVKLHTLYTFVHTTGLTSTSTVWEFVNTHDVNKSHVYQLAKGNISAHKGWTILRT
jgi:hypothetical protein